jgi:hypothetical protein
MSVAPNTIERNQSGAESPTLRARRKPIPVYKLLFALAALAAVATLISIKRSSTLKWYISPPMDSQGRRVHVLMPEGWKSSAASNENAFMWAAKTSDEYQIIVLKPEAMRKSTMVQRWLEALHLISPAEDDQIIIIEAEKDNSDPGFTVDDNVHHRQEISPGRPWSARAIKIRGTGRLVSVISSFGREEYHRRMEDTICRSMYVK